MAQGTQAKVMTRPQERAVLDHVRTTRNPHRDRVLFLFSLKAGLRAKEIAALNMGHGRLRAQRRKKTHEKRARTRTKAWGNNARLQG